MVTPHVLVWDKSARHDGTFSRADFVFDQERNALTSFDVAAGVIEMLGDPGQSKGKAFIVSRARPASRE
jgi:hypothetical protein